MGTDTWGAVCWHKSNSAQQKGGVWLSAGSGNMGIVLATNLVNTRFAVGAKRTDQNQSTFNFL